MPYYVVERAVQGLIATEGKSIKGANVFLVGVAYKKDVYGLRESPSLKLIEFFQQRCVRMYYHDPYIPVLPRTRRHHFDLHSVPLTPENLAAMI